MIKQVFLLLLFLGLFDASISFSQPKLIVVISIDQFRYDYISRFRQHFGKNGFNYLLRNGANFNNATYKHATNTTGPGHAAMLSGTYGNVNGIVANDWFDRATNASKYCADDKSVSIVGSGGSGKSPRNFIGSPIGDELRLKNGFHSKVISISNKDRAAILMAGKNPTGVYWQADSVFVTSTYYRPDLPHWVESFNRSRYIDTFFGRIWAKKLHDSAYRFVDPDNAPYEQEKDGMGRTFPHKIFGKDSTRITASYYWALNRSPFGAHVVNELAKRALQGEQLGMRNVTDMLCVSFSSTDIVGHAYGPFSQEVMDMALRMDDILADFFSVLDKGIGLKNCIIVLTADHGIAPAPEYVMAHNRNADAGRISLSTISQTCNGILNKRFGEPKEGMQWIRSIMANNIYFDRTTFTIMNYPTVEWAARELSDSLRTIHPFAVAFTARELLQPSHTTPIESKMKRSFYKSRSGDVVYALKPYWTEGDSPTGASHGEPYEYDAHVPLIFCGNGIARGEFSTEASPIDISPTLSVLLGIEFSAGHDGRVLQQALLPR